MAALSVTVPDFLTPGSESRIQETKLGAGIFCAVNGKMCVPGSRINQSNLPDGEMLWPVIAEEQVQGEILSDSGISVTQIYSLTLFSIFSMGTGSHSLGMLLEEDVV